MRQRRWILDTAVAARVLAVALAAALLSGPGSSTAARAAEKEKPKEKKPEHRQLAIVGGMVHTVTGPDLDGVTILCRDGRIHAIGHDVEIPADAERIDARGLHVYPGLVALASSGLVGYGDPETSTDVFNLTMTLGLAGGLTTVVTGNTAAKLTHGSVDGIVLRRNLFESISYSSRSPSSKRRFRQALERVRRYLRDLERYEELKRRGDPDAKKPDERWLRGQYRQALRLIKGEAVARVSATRAGDLLAIADLATEYGFRFVVSGAAEGWIVARELARAGAAAIVTPRTRIDPDERAVRPTGSSIENARILDDHGIPIGIVPPSSFISTGGLAGRDLLHLPMEAAYAVRGGLPERTAIEAITIQAARIIGVDHRVGSIEIGKDADLAVTDGPLLHYMTTVRWTIVNGRVAYDKEKESLFSHIRPGGDRDAPPPADHWPRRLGEEW